MLGGALTAAGVAATFDIAAPILVASLGLAVVASRAGGVDRPLGLAWAAAAGLAPVARVLDEAAFTGMGVMRDIGLLDSASIAETAAAGTLATAAFGWVWWRDRSPLAGTLAVAAAGGTGLEVWARFDPPSTIALLVLAVVVGLVEVGFAADRLASVRDDLRDSAELANTVVLGVMTLVVGALAWTHAMDGVAVAEDLPFTAGVLALAWVVGDARRTARGEAWALTLPGLATAAFAAVALATDRPEIVAAVIFAVAHIDTRSGYRSAALDDRLTSWLITLSRSSNAASSSTGSPCRVAGSAITATIREA